MLHGVYITYKTLPMYNTIIYLLLKYGHWSCRHRTQQNKNLQHSTLNRIEYYLTYIYRYMEVAVNRGKKSPMEYRRNEWCVYRREKKRWRFGDDDDDKMASRGRRCTRTGEMRNKTHGVCFLCRSGRGGCVLFLSLSGHIFSACPRAERYRTRT